MVKLLDRRQLSLQLAPAEPGETTKTGKNYAIGRFARVHFYTRHSPDFLSTK